MAELTDEFHHAMIDLYEVAKGHNYFATYFKQMLDQYQGVETAKRLLARQEIQPGLERLWALKLLDQSVEAKVLQERFRPLFTQAELDEAYRRLEALDYFKTPK
jgi:hypothetical protein